MHVDSSAVIHYANKCALRYRTITEGRACPIFSSGSTLTRFSNFCEAKQILASRYSFWLMNIFTGFSTNLPHTSTSHKCFRIYKGPFISFRLGGGGNIFFLGGDHWILSMTVDNTLLDLQNSSYPTQPHSIIAKYPTTNIRAYFRPKWRLLC